MILHTPPRGGSTHSSPRHLPAAAAFTCRRRAVHSYAGLVRIAEKGRARLRARLPAGRPPPVR
eukprot:6355948-Pyramimonas_sp.AAC.1